MNEAQPNQPHAPEESVPRPEQATPAPKEKNEQKGLSFPTIDIQRIGILLCILGVLYVTMRNYYYKISREEQKLVEEVNELISESKTLSADLMSLSKESEVSRMVKEQQIDLEESRRPPIRIKYCER